MQTLLSIYAFLFKSMQFIIHNFSHVDYAHLLIIKTDEISLAENLTVTPSTWVNSVQKLQSMGSRIFVEQLGVNQATLS